MTWQPIDTAPKDGTSVLTGAWVWDGEEWTWETLEDYYGNYHGRNPDGSNRPWRPLEDADGKRTVTPTHYHPIAKPPKPPTEPTQ